MTLKRFFILIYLGAGLLIASFTALMTYLIIDEPIGMKMVGKITLSILLTLPIIAGITLILERYLSKKINRIKDRLDSIQTLDIELPTQPESIREFSAIHHCVDDLALRLNDAMGKLHQQNRTLEEMLVSFAHDIKTPLTIIIGYAQELEEDQQAVQRSGHAVEMIQKESLFINELTLDLLEYISSMHTQRPQQTIELSSFLAQEILPLLDPKPDQRIITKLDPSDTILFNPIDLKKVLCNLLENSIKFTQTGDITISYCGNILSIKDSGTGIAPEHIVRIFEPFYTTDSSKNRRKSGFGLGLSIASNLCTQNGYQLSAQSRMNEGSSFTIQSK